MSEHTPPPWRTRTEPNTHEVEARDAGGVWVLRASAWGRTVDERDANARLIARAVNAHADLLAACESVCGVFEGQGDVPIYVREARAAIAKATNL